MKKLSLLLLGLCVSFAAMSQAVLKFEETEHDFGKIYEKDGDVRHDFTFTNDGDSVLIITNVRASCGCTTPSWTKTPVEPGKSGKISVKYSTRNRPGKFEKIINVASNDPRGSARLTITGTVEGRPRTIQDDYPYSVANGLRIVDRNLVLGTMPRGKTTVESVGIANGGKQPVQIGIDGSSLPAWLTVKPAKTTLAPGERSEIQLTFDASKADLWGKFQPQFGLIVNGQKQPDPVKMSVIFVEDFSTVSRTALKMAPRADYSSFFYHFSDQPQGKTLTREFQITNGGQSDLIIRHIGPTSSRIKAKIDKTVIRPGDTATLTVTLDSKGVTGRLGEGVTIVTNDPARPARDIRVLANIVE